MSAPDVRRGALLVGAANLLSRLTGLLREVAFAAVFGAGAAADAFNAAFRIGNLLRELFAEGALSNAFVPLFAKVSEESGEREAWALANAFLGLLTLALGAVALGTIALAEPLVHLVASGYAEVPGKVALTATLTRILAPFVATISVASVFMGMLNVRGRFFLPAASPVLFNAAIVAACLGSERFEAWTGAPAVHAVAWAALIGGAAQAAVQLPSLRRAGYRLRPSLKGHPALRRLLSFLGPAVVAISVVQINLLIETQLASREGDGPVSWLLYAFRVAHLPFSIVSGSVAVAGLAGLSVLAARRDHVGFRTTLAQALNLNAFLLIPSAVGLFLLANPLVAALFERGAFTAADTAVTAELLRAYSVAILAIGAQRILVPVFYTLGDPRTPMWVGLATVLLKAPVALALMLPLGLAGIPASQAVLAGAESLALLFILDRRVGRLEGLLLGVHLKSVLAAALMGLGVAGALRALPEPGLPALIGISAAGGLLYLLAAHVLGVQEARDVLARLRPGPPPGLPPTVDPDTRALLARLATEPRGAATLAQGRAELPLEDLVVIVISEDDTLRCEARIEAATAPLSPSPLRAVMRVGQGPPRLAGLDLGPPEAPELALRADGDAVVEGLAVGPRLDPAG
ncbi:MAG: murein biosynthesis integral membrane protein MurJ [Alphaproteobacteria bacterium]|nr:murein biosynthesis integral membrane protein MurJ [Alphaproteobacteria bacterium]